MPSLLASLRPCLPWPRAGPALRPGRAGGGAAWRRPGRGRCRSAGPSGATEGRCHSPGPIGVTEGRCYSPGPIGATEGRCHSPGPIGAGPPCRLQWFPFTLPCLPHDRHLPQANKDLGLKVKQPQPGLLFTVEKMGNAESNAYQNHLSRFLPEEQSDIDGLFDTLSGSSGSSGAKNAKAAKKTVTLAALQAHTREPLPQPMTARLYNGMKSIDLPGKSSGPSEQIAKEQFVIFMSNLLKGNADEKISIIMRMIDKTGGPLKGKQIREFTEDLITSVIHVLSYRKELKGWSLENTRDSSSGVKALASELLSELKLPDGTKPVGTQLLEANFDQSVIGDWVYRVPQISVFLSVVIRQGLHVLHSLPDQTNDILNLVPHCKGIKGRGVVSLFDIPAIIYINSHLPAEMQHKWQLLFSSRLHGESFSQLCAHIVNKGPCLVIIRDLDGFLFGGFASHSWEVKPQFQGDNRCFLFSVFPTLAVYTYTGYNEHYMYLNHGQQTMPNGLGMGGQHGYFGLWIDSDYGKGHSKAKPRCTTYNSPQLSAKEDFTLDALEVWAVGDTPESAGRKGKKSILDVDPQAQALLEMAGKSRQSEGLREPMEEEEGDDDEN